MAKLVASFLMVFTLLMMLTIITNCEEESWSDWAKHKLEGGEKAVGDAAGKAKGKVEDAVTDTRRHASEVGQKAAKKAKEAGSDAKHKASMSFESNTNSKPDSFSVEKKPDSFSVEKKPDSFSVEGTHN